VALGGEFGGCGAVSRSCQAIVESGLRRLLAHAGIMEPEPAAPPPSPTRLWEVAGRDYYVLAPDAGLFEPAVSLGEHVEGGQLCGHVHFVDNPGRPPEAVRFARAGMVICRRHLGRVERGDCVVHLATEWKG
jgi:predicted deacylase